MIFLLGNSYERYCLMSMAFLIAFVIPGAAFSSDDHSTPLATQSSTPPPNTATTSLSDTPRENPKITAIREKQKKEREDEWRRREEMQKRNDEWRKINDRVSYEKNKTNWEAVKDYIKKIPQDPNLPDTADVTGVRDNHLDGDGPWLTPKPKPQY
jgi:hypothetical protein